MDNIKIFRSNFKIIKIYKKDIIRIEFKIIEAKSKSEFEKNQNVDFIQDKENISFIKDSFLQYNRIDPNKRFENFILGRSNKLAYEASLKTIENHIIIIHFIFMLELVWEKHIC